MIYQIMYTLFAIFFFGFGPVLMALSLYRKFKGDNPWPSYFGGVVGVLTWFIGSSYNYPTATVVIRIICIAVIVGVFLINRFYTPKL